MKILPIASGKGGVGKTTIALNLALTLSKKHNTVLIDMDTGTSSVRNFLEMKIDKDLYHFLKKDIPLNHCLTPINKSLDPERLFNKFRMIASPKNFIHDIVNLKDDLRERLINGINSLKADYVIIDNKAGLDHEVINMLPLTNTGILIFTPKVKAATQTAAEMAKAAILRQMNIVMDRSNRFANQYSQKIRTDLLAMNEIMEEFEADHYQNNLNFDHLFNGPMEKHQGNYFLLTFKKLIENYRVYFVLNQFNSVNESAKKIVQPFIENIYSSISTHVSTHNLGWVVEDREVKKSAEEGIPYVVLQDYKRSKKKKKDKLWDDQLRNLLGIRKPKMKKDKVVNTEVTKQIDLMKNMYVSGAGKDPKTNFDFIAERIKACTDSSIHDCGMSRIYNIREIHNHLITPERDN